jgi:Domain of unknown function (DUF4136)
MRMPAGRLFLTIAAGILVSVQSGAAAPKIHVDFDKTFAFTQAHTYAWNPAKAGSIMVARTADDDPESIQRQAEPVIMSAVGAEMPRHGLTPALGAPDLTVTYYLLLTLSSSAQTLGQFLPPVTDWALPPFAPSTQSLKVIHQGSLVLDFSANGKVVWRGVAEADIKMGLPMEKRIALIREAVAEILKRYPPKK